MLKEYLKELEQLSDELKILKHPGKLSIHIDKNLSSNNSNRRYEQVLIYYSPDDPAQKELLSKIREHSSEIRQLYIELGELRKASLKEKIMKETV